MAKRVDYKPSFERSPKDLQSLRYQELVDEEKALSPAPVVEDIEEPKVTDPEEIVTPKDLADVIDTLQDNLNKVDERAQALEESLDFNPIELPDELATATQILGQSENVLTSGLVNCITKVRNYEVNDINEKDIGEQVEAIEEKEKDWFPDFGNKFLIILFFMFLKGITWEILSTLCRFFRTLKLKIGPFRPCIGCPFAKIFKKLVKALNHGKEYKVDNDGNPILNENGALQKWESCPPPFDPYGFQPENAVVNGLREGEYSESQPTSICESDAAPTTIEIEAANKIVDYVLTDSIKNPTDDKTKAANLIYTKQNNVSNRSNISNMLVNSARANDPKETVYDITPAKPLTQPASIKVDFEKAVSDYLNTTVVSETTKNVLVLANGMLRVWDSFISATNEIVNVNKLDKKLICCFLNSFGLIFPSINFSKAVAIKKIASAIKIINLLIDMELDEISVSFSATYFTLAELQNAITDSILRTVMAILGPLVDGVCEDINGKFDPDKIREKLGAQIVAGATNVDTSLADSLQECISFNFLSDFLKLKVGTLRAKVMSWMLGFKGQSDLSTKKLEYSTQLSAKAKLLSTYKLILNKIQVGLEKNASLIISLCDNDGNISPVDITTVEDELGLTDVSTSQLPAPVYSPDDVVGISPDDIVDTIYQDGEFYEPTYGTMVDYQSDREIDGTIVADTQPSDAVSTEKVNDKTTQDDATDQNIRTCIDASNLSALFEQANKIDNLKTLFDL